MKYDDRILAIFDPATENKIEPILNNWNNQGFHIHRVSSIADAQRLLPKEHFVIVTIQCDNIEFVPILPTFLKYIGIPIVLLPYVHLEKTQEISFITRILIHCMYDEHDYSQESTKGLEDLLINPHQRKVFAHNIEIPLSRIEFDLLSELVHKPNIVRTYEYLYTAVWGEEYLESKNALHSAVKRLRDRFGRLGIPLNIENVRGIGYRFTFPI